MGIRPITWRLQKIKEYGVLAVPYLKQAENKSDNLDVAKRAIEMIERDYISKTKSRKISESDLEDMYEMIYEKR